MTKRRGVSEPPPGRMKKARTLNLNQIQNTAHQSQRRAEQEFRNEEMQRNSAARRDVRLNTDFRADELLKDLRTRRKTRADGQLRAQEKERDATPRRNVRSDNEVRAQDKERDATARRSVRLNIGFRAEEQLRNTRARREIRSDVEVRAQEQERDATARRSVRLNIGFRAEEQLRKTRARREIRSDVEVRAQEQERDATARRSVRLNIGFRAEEQLKNTRARREIRSDVEVLAQEQERDATARRSVRSKVGVRAKEQVENTIVRKSKRKDEEIRASERQKDSYLHQITRAQTKGLWDAVLANFHLKTGDGPTHVCNCCGGLFFKKSIRLTSQHALESSGIGKEYLAKVVYINTEVEELFFCTTCMNCIKNSKIPKLCREIERVVVSAYSRLTERLYTTRRTSNRSTSTVYDATASRVGSAVRTQGDIVNVPIDVSSTEKVLPRRITDSSVVHLALMRRMDYKHPYMFETVRPANVYNACKYLVTTPLYKQEGITLSDEWENISVPVDFNEGTSEKVSINVNAEQMSSSDSDSEEAHEPLRSEETLLIENTDLRNCALKYAPGQDNRPVALLWDLNADVLSFPTIYCGQPRIVSSKLSYPDIAKSEARNQDRRACVPQKLLYSFKKSQIHQIVDSISVSLRKKSNVQNVTAGDLLNNEFVAGLQQRNEGFMVLSNIRSSPAYWEARKKELFATIRQLGVPTFFHTVSAMDTDWPELLVILKRILDDIQLSETDASNMSQNEKNDLVRRDPMTCARYFDSKTKDYFNLILKSGTVFTLHPLRDYFMRVEFQHRGSPHLHIFLWLKDAPKYDPENPFLCAPFIDTYISTTKTEHSIEFQQHRHTHCCRRLVNGAHICRFGIPYAPMESTQILIPLPKEFPAGKRILLKREITRIKSELESLRRSNLLSVTYAVFLEQLNISKDEYILAIRSDIRRPTVFLKREPESSFTNAYNEKLISAWLPTTTNQNMVVLL